MIPLTNHDFQWGRSEVVIIYPDICIYDICVCVAKFPWFTNLKPAAGYGDDFPQIRISRSEVALIYPNI